MRPQAILFDLDGCLVDSEPLSLGALCEQMHAVGVSDITVEAVRDRYLGVSTPDVCRDIEALLGRPCPDDFREKFDSRLFASYINGVPRIEKMVSTLEQFLAEGLACCIVSGGSLTRIRVTLKQSGLTDHFGDHIYSGEDVPRGKPAPDLVLHAAARLGVEPSRCVVVEDSPHGIKGAIAAGMRAVGFTGGTHLEGIRQSHSATLMDAGAECVVADASDLYGAVFQTSDIAS